MGWMRWEPYAEQLDGGASYDTGCATIETTGPTATITANCCRCATPSNCHYDQLPQGTAGAREATDTAPEPPRTPEQPTVAISRVILSKGNAR